MYRACQLVSSVCTIIRRSIIYACVYTVGVKKRKRFVITLQKYYSTLYINYNAYYAKLQIVLQKTTDRTTQNYRLYYTKLQIIIVLQKLRQSSTYVHANYIVILHIHNQLRSYTCTGMGSIAQNLYSYRISYI